MKMFTTHIDESGEWRKGFSRHFGIVGINRKHNWLVIYAEDGMTFDDLSKNGQYSRQEALNIVRQREREVNEHQAKNRRIKTK